MPTSSSPSQLRTTAPDPVHFERSERWLVLDSGVRLRVTVWPLEVVGPAPARACAAAYPVRFLVFESAPEGKREAVRIERGVALERLAAEDLWTLYKRARTVGGAPRRR